MTTSVGATHQKSSPSQTNGRAAPLSDPARGRSEGWEYHPLRLSRLGTPCAPPAARGFARIPGKQGQHGILAGAREEFVYSSNNSPNTPTFSPRTAAEPARMGCEGEGALHLRILASFARGVRVCLRSLGSHRKWLSIRLIRRIAGTVPSSPAIAIPSLVLHRRRRP